MRPEIGDHIAIPCEANDGPFDGEYIVTLETLDGVITGFTPVENVREREGIYFIKAEVLAIEGDIYTLQIFGSFFTTNGLAHINRNETNFERIAA